MSNLDAWILWYLDSPWRVIGAAVALLVFLLLVVYRDDWFFYARLMLKSLRRNLVRTALTSIATFVLVLVVTMVWTVLYVLDRVTAEKSQDLKAIVTERWQIPSQMPFSYAQPLSEGAAKETNDVRPSDSMTWTFVGGTLDPAKRTRENIVFFFAMDPAKLMRAERDERGNLIRTKTGKIVFNTMMDDLDQLSDSEIDLLDQACREMEKDRRKVVIGKERLAQMNKKVGERFTLHCINYPFIELEMEIIGEFPDGRYNQSALMHRDYILDAMDAWKRKNGRPHPMAEKCLNLVWLRVPDREAFRRVAEQIEESPDFKSPAVKCETASSGIAAFLDAYRDLLWGMRYLLVPAILVTMSLVIANAISISVRERRTEMAVLKVLGYRPGQVLILVLGEALLLGVAAGLASAAASILFINTYLGGIKFPIAFFPAFFIPLDALWWGPALGALTAFVGSILPAWSARQVKVAEVFSKIS